MGGFGDSNKPNLKRQISQFFPFMHKLDKRKNERKPPTKLEELFGKKRASGG